MVDSQWGTTPKRSIEAECTARGRDAVIDGCRALVRGEVVDDALLTARAHWRVREMAITVVRVNRVRELLPDVQLLADDPVTRVRTATAKCTEALAIRPSSA